MTHLIRAKGLTAGWAQAVHYLDRLAGDKSYNLVVCITHPQPTAEVATIDLLSAINQKRSEPDVAAVANTLFPAHLYVPGAERAAEQLYERYQRIIPLLHRVRASARGTYFERMIAWRPSGGGRAFNQLADMVAKLQREHLAKGPKSSCYEMGIYQPKRDRSVMGFPCLSHISVKLEQQKVHLTAVYRNQQFLSRALGNYLGLARLQAFICEESGTRPGELVIIATHAELDRAGILKAELEVLLNTVPNQKRA